MPLTKQKGNKDIIVGPVGGLLGGGRRPKALQLQNYEKVLKVIDQTAEEAVAVIREGLQHPDWNIKIRCAQIVLNKYIPDKKSKEVTGKDGGPIEVTAIHKRENIGKIMDMLDEEQEIIMEKLEKHGTFGIPESDTGPTGEEETEVESQETIDSGGERPGESDSGTEGDQSDSNSEECF
jgi:hypothetical protein